MDETNKVKTETIEVPFRPDEEAPYIFISYAHADRKRIFPIIKRLYEKGWRVWYDEGLPVAENYYASLSTHIKNCALFLLFVTENSVRSEFVSEHELLCWQWGRASGSASAVHADLSGRRRPGGRGRCPGKRGSRKRRQAFGRQ